MKTKVLKTTLVLAVMAILCSVFSCAGSSPIIGTWADSAGNTIVLEKEGNFNATILDSTKTPQSLTGSYTVNLNVMVFDSSDGSTILSEWDLRGAILYIKWTDKYGKPSDVLTLYKTK